MATAIEYGLLAALATVVVATGFTVAEERPVITRHFPYVGLEKIVLPPIPPRPHWTCPAGTVMVSTSNYYPSEQPACVAGAYATSTINRWRSGWK